MDSERAREILGVKENANTAEIEKKYEILIKRYMYAREDNSEQTLNDINEAYKCLTEALDTNSLEHTESLIKKDEEKKPFFKNDKVSNFFYYYKFHLIVSIGLAFFVSMFIYTTVTKINNDLTIAFIGDYEYSLDENLPSQIEKGFPEAKNINVEVVPKKVGDSVMEIDTKIEVMMAVGDTDIFILDKTLFTSYGKLGAFKKLDGLITASGDSEKKGQLFKLENENDNKNYLYGVDVTNSALLKNDVNSGKEKIAVINRNAKHPDTALKFIKLLMGTTK